MVRRAARTYESNEIVRIIKHGRFTFWRAAQRFVDFLEGTFRMMIGWHGNFDDMRDNSFPVGSLTRGESWKKRPVGSAPPLSQPTRTLFTITCVIQVSHGNALWYWRSMNIQDGGSRNIRSSLLPVLEDNSHKDLIRWLHTFRQGQCCAIGFQFDTQQLQGTNVPAKNFRRLITRPRPKRPGAES